MVCSRENPTASEGSPQLTALTRGFPLFQSMSRPVLPLILAAVVLPFSLHAAEPSQLLTAAVDKWSDDVQRWSFVQHVREYRGGEVAEEREERFDPSKPDAERWQLLSINDRAPTAREKRAFDERKNRKPRQRVADPLRYIDLERVSVVDENDTCITFEVPLRSDLSVFIPFETIAARVEVDRRSRCIRRLEIGLLREMRIAFGLARVTRLDMEFDLAPDAADAGASGAPAATEGASGRASATLSKLGRRVEISWSDFARVGAAASPGS